MVVHDTPRSAGGVLPPADVLHLPQQRYTFVAVLQEEGHVTRLVAALCHRSSRSGPSSFAAPCSIFAPSLWTAVIVPLLLLSHQLLPLSVEMPSFSSL